MVISMLKIRRPLGRLIFNMGIAIPGKTVFLIETDPWFYQGAVIRLEIMPMRRPATMDGETMCHLLQAMRQMEISLGQ